MKRTERHHLKENELHNLARQAREGFDSRRRETTFIIAALAVVGVLAAGYFVWHQRVESRAHALLAEALVVQSARVGAPAAPGTAGAGQPELPHRARQGPGRGRQVQGGRRRLSVDRRRHLCPLSGRRDLDLRSASPRRRSAPISR